MTRPTHCAPLWTSSQVSIALSLIVTACTSVSEPKEVMHSDEVTVTQPERPAPKVSPELVEQRRVDVDTSSSSAQADRQKMEAPTTGPGACERLETCCASWSKSSADIQTTCAIHREAIDAQTDPERANKDCALLLQAWRHIKGAPEVCQNDT